MVVVVGCGKDSHDAPPPVRDAATVRDAPAALAKVDATAHKVFVTGAGRCGECHGKMYDEWELSAHAKAVSSPLYVASLASVGATDAKDANRTRGEPVTTAACDHCHAPLGSDGGIVTSEGVTCDVCHTLREPKPGGSFRLAIDDMVKYGPRCDLKDHYFHRMGCSPEHDTALICGTCHSWSPNGVPVFTEYDDFLAGPAAKRGKICQSCHMPKERAPLATGSPAREGVPHHGLLGAATDLRTRALELEASTKDAHGTLEVTVTLRNVTAGHTVPAGLPERRIVVHVRVHDTGGHDAEQSTALGRVLVDATGKEVPFWRAAKVGNDSRIAAGGQWQSAFSFTAKGPGTIDVAVAYRAMSEPVAADLHVTDIVEQPMTSVTLAFNAHHVGKAVVVTPKPAGRSEKKHVEHKPVAP